MTHSKPKRILSGITTALLVLVLGYLLIRPLHLRWGATDEDLARMMPGDLSGARWTRAILIEATPEQIWPWLVQWGQGRGGWYSYDWLENLLGFDIHTADRILPEHQNPQIGDPICMAAGVCNSFVSVIEPYQWFGWQAKDDMGKPVWTFVFGLFPLDNSHTRLVVRESFDPTAMPSAVTAMIEIPDVVMELKALNTVRQRAEGKPQSNFLAAYEITIWLVVFIVGLIAGILFVSGKGWRKNLSLGAASIMVLLLITFMFPPLWLRGLLATSLLAWLICSFVTERTTRTNQR